MFTKIRGPIIVLGAVLGWGDGRCTGIGPYGQRWTRFFSTLETRMAGPVMGLIGRLLLPFIVGAVASCSCGKRVKLPLDEVLDEFRVFLRSRQMTMLKQQLDLAVG